MINVGDLFDGKYIDVGIILDLAMEIFDYKLPEELEEILNSLEYEEEGGIVIKNVRFDKADTYITVNIFCGSLDLPVQVWEVKIIDEKTEKITVNWSSDLLFYSDHFLLTEYQDNYAELYFTGTSDRADEIFIDIYKSLIELDSNVNIAKYVYSPTALNLLCKQGHGLFARGQKSILSIYQKALSNQGIKTKYVSEIEPSPEQKDMKLLMIGESYIVGASFVFNRI